jgi:hypothetical protein
MFGYHDVAETEPNEPSGNGTHVMKRIRLTPTLLALALACFFLPWFEFRCDMGTMTQTGWQRARGNYTFTPAIGRDAPEAQTVEQVEELSDPNAAWHAASVVIGLCIAVFIHAAPWRHVLLFITTTSACTFLAWVTRNYYNWTESMADIPWKFTPWFFATWALSAAALVSVMREIAMLARREITTQLKQENGQPRNE